MVLMCFKKIFKIIGLRLWYLMPISTIRDNIQVLSISKNILDMVFLYFSYIMINIFNTEINEQSKNRHTWTVLFVIK